MTCCQNRTTKSNPSLKNFGLRRKLIQEAQSAPTSECRRAFPRFLTVFAIVAFLWGAPSGRAIVADDIQPPLPRANFFTNTFDDANSTTVWQPTLPLEPFVVNHQIAPHSGSNRCEQFAFNSPQVLTEQRIELGIAPSLVFDEVTAALSVRSYCPNLRVALHIRFPNQTDPRTRKPLEIDLVGDAYQEGAEFGTWQKLVCRASDEALRSRLLRVRADWARDTGPAELDTSGMYIDRISLIFRLPHGASGIQIDDFEMGPIVAPASTPSAREQIQKPAEPTLSIVGDRVFKMDQPFFPVFTVYHGESLERVTETGANTLWISDYSNEHLLTALSDMGIGAFAQPPRPPQNASIIQASGLATLPEWTSGVWGWMLGVQIPGDQLGYVSSWVDQIQDADRVYRRPILADVRSHERAYHRQVSFLGSSVFPVHSDIDMANYLDLLRGRQNNALLGKPMFTFVQTEASLDLLSAAEDGGEIPIVEPEQILFQAYAAIAAGYKGVGFWKQIPFDDPHAGLNERILAIRLFALHCRILEPWLATGRIADEVPVQIDDGTPRTASPVLRSLTSRWDNVLPQDASTPQRTSEIRATKIVSDRGELIIPVWYQPGMQCLPGPMAAKSVRILVASCNEPEAWQVSPTQVAPFELELTRLNGGTEIRIKDFDQSAVIVFTRDARALEQLRRTCEDVRGEVAQTSVKLAQLKFQRVQAVHEELQAFAPRVADAEQTLSSARTWLTRAESELQSGHDHDARLASLKSLQYLRQLQRQHWENAVSSMTSVTSSPLATNFQTLPAHWRLMADIKRRQNTSENLCPSGDFESDQAIVAAGWTDASEDEATSQHFLGRTSDSGQALMLRRTAPGHQLDHPTLLLSPQIPLEQGQLVVISGKVWTPRPLDQTTDGFLVYEALTAASEEVDGKQTKRENRGGSVRIHDTKGEWKQFSLIRKIPEDATLRVCFELASSGEIAVDDVQVRRLEY